MAEIENHPADSVIESPGTSSDQDTTTEPSEPLGDTGSTLLGKPPVNKPKDDPNHVCFVDLALQKPPSTAQSALKEAQADIDAFKSFIMQTANSSVDAKINSGQIKNTDFLAQNNFRAKVAAWVIDNKTTWLSKTSNLNAIQVLSYKKNDSARTLLHQLLGVLNISEKTYPDLERTLTTSADWMKSACLSTASDKNMVWVMVAQHKIVEEHDTIQSTIQTLSYNAVQSAPEPVKGGKGKPAPKPQDGGFTTQISTSQYDFNHQIWRDVMKS